MPKSLSGWCPTRTSPGEPTYGTRLKRPRCNNRLRNRWRRLLLARAPSLPGRRWPALDAEHPIARTDCGAASAEPILRLRGLEKRYGGVVVLRGVDLDVRPREFLTILGPSGSGKTTILR